MYTDWRNKTFFTDYMIISEKSEPLKYIKLISGYNKVARYKANMQKN